MGAELSEAIQLANEDDDVVAMVLTGEGRGFAQALTSKLSSRLGPTVKIPVILVGLGTGSIKSESQSQWLPLLTEQRWSRMTQVLPMDYLIASDQAKLSMRFVKMGLVPELASSHFLASRLGFGNASELMLSGKTIMANEAKELGLVDRVTNQEELLPVAIEVARGMGDNPLASVRHIKKLLTANASDSDLKAVQKREMEALQECYVSEEHKEAISAFLEKREPDFKAARNR